MRLPRRTMERVVEVQPIDDLMKMFDGRIGEVPLW